jgi:uncharacterized protein YbjQ (UPF0145 family)
MLLVTSPSIDGKKVVRVLGLVQGNSVRARHLGHDIWAFIKTIFGGEIRSYTDLLTYTRKQATDNMVAEAQTLGANAVVNVRYNTASIMNGAAEILAYGTAVVVEE